MPVAVCNKAVESPANLPEKRRTILATTFLKGIKSARIKECRIKGVDFLYFLLIFPICIICTLV